jgi:hypothetical protein
MRIESALPLVLLFSEALAGQDAVRRFPYAHLDVFTEEPLSGNPLAVFFEPSSLTAEEMLAMTREMGFSETTFVFPAESPGPLTKTPPV